MKKTLTARINLDMVLTKIRGKDIVTISSLKKDESLYCEYWMATFDFVKLALSTKINRAKILVIETNSINSSEDIENDCMEKIIRKSDLIFSQPLEKQINYTHTIINNRVNEYFRKIPPIPPVPIEPITENETEFTKSFEIPDYSHCPESIFFGQERLKELIKMYEEKTRKENLSKAAEINKGIVLIAKSFKSSKAVIEHSIVLLACTYLKYTPRKLAERLCSDQNWMETCAAIYNESIRLFDIDLSPIHEHINNYGLDTLILKLDSNNKDEIKGEISRVKYRYKKLADPDNSKKK